MFVMASSCHQPRSSRRSFCLFALVTTITLSRVSYHPSLLHVCAGEEEGAHLIQSQVRDAAFRALGEHPKTGVLYDVKLPPRLAGVEALVVRYRSGSLRRHGGGQVGEFRLHKGLVVHPFVERLVAVRSNLGNFSSAYQRFCNAAGYRLVSPVTSLLVYVAASLRNSPTNLSWLPELDITATGRQAIVVDLSAATRQSGDGGSRCAMLESDGKLTLFDPRPGDVCVTRRQGHFALVTAWSPASRGEKLGGSACRWKVVLAGTVGGLLGAALLGLLCVAFVKVKKRREVSEMERRAYEEEVLQVSMVGHVRAPTAAAARTAPALEDDYVPPHL